MKSLILITLFLYGQFVSAQVHNHENHLKCCHKSLKANKIEVAKDLTKYDVKFYYLDIEATDKSTSLNGFTKILATNGNENLNSFVIELNSNIHVDSVLINATSYAFNHTNDKITVSLSNPIPVNTDFTAQIFYKRPGSLNTPGIYNAYVEEWDNFVTYTLSEPYYAKNWFACKQDLYDKADSVHVFVTLDDNLKAGANGLLTNVVDLGNGKKRYEWKSNYPIAYYLISIAVANYTEYNSYAKPTELNGDSILIQNYLYNNYDGLENQKEGLGVTADLINLFSEKYSLYPFWQEKYGHCYAPMGGAMEHQTMTTTGSHSFYIIAHELGHQWFGDNVTCGTWQDIWINEGFASYSEYLAFENLYSAADAKEWLLYAQNVAKESPTGSVYVPFEDLNNDSRIFSWSLTYRKGLCLVHMIRKELNNDELFFDILRGFQTTYKDNSATGANFRDYLNENSGTDFTNFFNEWYYGEGYPSYYCNWSQQENVVNITINQTTTATSTPLFTNTIEFKLFYDGGDTIVRLKPSAIEETFQINLNQNITSVEIDPNSNIVSGTKEIINAIDDHFFSHTKVYPNPFENEIKINSNSIIKKIEVFNCSGKKHFECSPESKEYKIETTGWNHGIYFIRSYSENISETYRVLKN